MFNYLSFISIIFASIYSQDQDIEVIELSRDSEISIYDSNIDWRRAFINHHPISLIKNIPIDSKNLSNFASILKSAEEFGLDGFEIAKCACRYSPSLFAECKKRYKLTISQIMALDGIEKNGKRLVEVVRDGNLRYAEILLNGQTGVNCPVQDLTALDIAAMNNDLKMCLLLSRHHAKAQTKNLINADNSKLLELFLNKPYIDTYELAQKSCQNRKKKNLVFLLDKIQYSNNQLIQLLEEESSQSDATFEIIKLILNKCAKNCHSNVLIYLARSKKLRELKEALKYTKHKINEALDDAIRVDFLEGVNLLLKEGAVPSAISLSDVFAIGSNSMFEVLVHKFKIPDNALITSLNAGKLERVSKLLDLGLNPNQIVDQNTGRTLLMYAAERGYLEIVIKLVKAGANKDAMDSVGNQALSIALSNNHLRIVSFLDKGTYCCEDQLENCKMAGRSCTMNIKHNLCDNCGIPKDCLTASLKHYCCCDGCEYCRNSLDFCSCDSEYRTCQQQCCEYFTHHDLYCCPCCDNHCLGLSNCLSRTLAAIFCCCAVGESRDHYLPPRPNTWFHR